MSQLLNGVRPQAGWKSAESLCEFNIEASSCDFGWTLKGAAIQRTA